jgi:peroxiredoxin Q/BCP
MKGDCVPDFTLPAHDGTEITLSDYRGQWVVFSSFPMVNTSVCTGQMQKLDAMYDDFIENNIQPFGFNNEPPDQKDEWCETMNVTKLLILSDHDPKDEISKKFGISGTYTKRADTIIDPQGRFVEVIPSSGATSVEPLLEHIKELQK